MPAFTATAPGKIILAGEHAVVYGQPAIAFPLPEIRAKVVIEPQINQSSGKITFDAPDVGVTGSSETLPSDHALKRILQVFQGYFQIPQIPACLIRVSSTIPIASGMGSGTAVSAAMFRALAVFTGKGISDQEVSDLTYEIEKTFHGNPSGIDNTVVAFQRPVYFMKNHPVETLHLKRSFTFLLADTGIKSSTRFAVEGVRERWEKCQDRYNGYFDAIGNVVRQIREGLIKGDQRSVGELMNQNHEILQKIGVSNTALDTLVKEALKEKAYGAKLIGAGLGGSMAALLAIENAQSVANKLKKAGAVWTLISTFQPSE
jgi:mevalonate kinase